MTPEQLDRRAMDEDFYPVALDTAHDLIAILRDRIREGHVEAPKELRPRVTQPDKIYALLKKYPGGVTHGQIFAVLYPGKDPPDAVDQIVKVLVSRLRHKLPHDERIVNVFGEGYVLGRVAA